MVDNFDCSPHLMLKIALAQLNPTIGDIVGNGERILAVAERAVADRVDLLLTPELSLCGYPPRDLLLNASLRQAMADKLQDVAGRLPAQLSVLVGLATIAEPPGKPLHNSMALLQGGEVRQIFHKRLLPTYDVFDENRYFQAGESSNYFEIGNYRVGVSICEDLWNDEEFWGKQQYVANPIAELAAQSVDLIVNLSASPYSVGKQRVREAMLQHVARRYQQAIVYVNQIGANDDLIFDGGSIGCDRQGKVVGRGRSFAEDLPILCFDGDRLGDLSLGTIEAPLEEPEEIWQALVLGVGDYARKCGFQKALLGLSGGIDSALVAAIAVAALGAEKVLGVLMPSPYSSDHSVSDALAVAKNLGMVTQTIPIGDLMKQFDFSLQPLFAGTEFGIAEENLQSRIRGSLLMAISNKFGHLLISTGNKSEMAVGYCTLYGDMNGGLAAIADLPKTKVYALCRWLNREREVIPVNIIEKPPSAELRPGQLDQDSLPPYEVLDEILEGLVCNHCAVADLVAEGFDRSTVQRVAQLLQRAEFKRRQAPPGLKITDRAFGTGWRMPIAASVQKTKIDN
jgi:NAD+ synthase (glutamine-hydrolysing)